MVRKSYSLLPVGPGPQVVLQNARRRRQLLAGAVDDAMMPDVMGCIAGDDTVLVITRGARVRSRCGQAPARFLADPSARA